MRNWETDESTQDLFAMLDEEGMTQDQPATVITAAEGPLNI